MSKWGDYDISESNNTLTITGTIGKFAGDNSITLTNEKSSFNKVVFNGPVVFNNKTKTNNTFSGFFSGFTNLQYIEGLENVDTSNVNDLSGLFSGCSSLEYINVSSLNLSNVNNISSMFNGCSKLIQIDGLNKWDTSKVINMNSVFSGCSSLRELDLSGWDVSKVTTATSIISECSKLYKLKTPSTLSNTFITGCIKANEKWGKMKKNLTSTDCSAFTTDVTTGMQTKTTYCKDRQNVWGYLEDGCDYEISSDNTILTIYGGRGKTTETAGVNGAASTYTSPFDSIKSTISKIIIEGKITFSDKVSLQNLFSGFSKLVEVEGIKNINGDNVTDITSMFEGCTVLIEADLSSFKYENATNDNCFKGCTNLLTFKAPNVTSATLGITGEWSKAGQDANWITVTDTGEINLTAYATYYKKFENELTGVNNLFGKHRIHNDNTLVIEKQGTTYNVSSSLWLDQKDNITSVRILSQDSAIPFTQLSKMFEGLDNITEVYGLENIITSATTNISSMFNGCSKLTKLDLSKIAFGDSVTFTDFIKDCSGLTEIIMPKQIPEALKAELVKITDSTWITTVDTTFSKFSAINIIPGMRYFSNNYATKWNECIYFTTDTHTDNVSKCTLHILGGKGNTTETKTTGEGGVETSTYTSPFSTLATKVDKVIIENPISFSEDVSLQNLFNGFTKLTEVIGLDKLDTSNVTDMTSMFNGCSKLTKADISKFNTSKVTAFNSMFNGCSALTQLDFSSFTPVTTTPTVENIIKDCSGLKRVVTSKITGLNEAIKGVILNGTNKWKAETSCNSEFNTTISTLVNSIGYVKDVIDGDTTVKKWGETTDTTKYCVYWIEDSVMYLSNGMGKTTSNGASTPVYISPFNSVKHSITKIVLLGPINFSDGTSLRYLFRGFSCLTEIVNMSYLDISHTNDLFNMFDGCKNLKNIDTTIFNSGHAIALMNKHYHNKDLTARSINLFNTYNVTNMSNMFNECKALTDIDLSKITLGPGIANISNMFSGCEKLTNADLSNFNIANSDVTCSGIFNNCTKLTHIRTPKIMSTALETAIKTNLSTTDKWKNDNNATTVFSANVSSLLPSSDYVKQVEDKWGDTDKECIYWRVEDTLYISGGTGSNNSNETSPFSKHSTVTKIVITGPIIFGASTSLQYLFSEFTNLTEIDGLDKLDTTNVINTSYMFNQCKKLRYLDISMLNLSGVTDMTSMFDGCEILKNIDVTMLDLSSVTNMSKMFNKCKLLESIDLTSVKFASASITLDSMFESCLSLKTIDFRCFNGVTAIASATNVINGCSNLMRVITSSNTFADLTLTGKWKDNSSSDNAFANVTSIVVSTDYVKEDTLHYWGNTTAAKYCVYWTEGSTLYISSGIGVTTEIKGEGESAASTYTSPFDSVKHLVSKIVFTGPITFTDNVTLNNLFVNFTQLTEVIGLHNINDKHDDPANEGTTLHYVTDITDMFSNCCLLKHLDLSMFKTEKFNMTGCVNLESVVAPEFTTALATNHFMKSWYAIGQTTADTIASKSVYLSSTTAKDKQWGTSYYTYDSTNNVNILTLHSGRGKTTSDGATPTPNYTSPFDASIKANIKTIIIDGPITFDEEVSLQSFCDGCAALEHIEGLEYIDFTKVTDVSKFFNGCTNLKSINFSKCNFNKTTTFTDMFGGSSSIISGLLRVITPKIIPSDLSTELSNLSTTEIKWKIDDSSSEFQTIATFSPSTDYIKENTTNKWGETANTINYCVYWTEGSTLYISGGIANTTSDGQNSPTYASPFNSIKSNITKVIFTGPVKLSTSGSLESLFSGFTNLTEVVGLDKIDGTTISSYNKFFSSCTSLKHFDLSNFNCTFTTTFTDIFSGCNSLGYIITPKIYTNNLNTGIITFISSNSKWKDNTVSTNEFKKYQTSDTLSPSTDYVIISNYYWGDGLSECVYWIEDSTLYISGGIGATDNITDSNPFSTITNPENITKIVITGPIELNATGARKNIFNIFTNVEEIVGLEKFDISKATDISGMFNGCKKLRQLDLSNFNTGNVTSFENMFNNCNCLSKIYGMSFSTSKVTNVNSMFKNCLSLQSVNTKSYDTGSLTNMTSMFNNCVSLRYLDLGTFNCSLTASDNIITSSNSIIELTTPITLGNDTVNTSFNTTVTTLFGSNKWKYLGNAINTISTVLPSTTYSKELETKWGDTTDKQVVFSIETIGNDKVLHLSGGIGKTTATTITNADKPTTTTYNLPFELIREDITKIIITGPITFDSGTSLAQLFNDFHNLNEIIGLEYIDVTNVTDLNNTLSETSLEYIDLSKWNTTNVTTFYGLFADNPKLRGVNLTNIRTNKVTTMYNMFGSCISLESIDLSSFSPNSLTTINSIFNNCKQLETLDLTNITNSQITSIIANVRISAITYCDKLHTIKTGPEVSTDVSEDLIAAFGEDWKLANDSATIQSFGTLSTIESNSYYVKKDVNTWGDTTQTNYCTWFTSQDNRILYVSNGKAKNQLIVPFDVTDITKIVILGKIEFETGSVLDDMLQNLTNLEYIEGLEYINTTNVTSMKNMFKGCSSLKTLNLISFEFINMANAASSDQTGGSDSGEGNNSGDSGTSSQSLKSRDESGESPAAPVELTGLTDFITDCSSLTRIIVPKTLTDKNNNTISLAFLTDVMYKKETDPNDPSQKITPQWYNNAGVEIVSSSPSATQIQIAAGMDCFKSTYLHRWNGLPVYIENNVLNICGGSTTASESFKLSDNTDDFTSIKFVNQITLTDNTTDPNKNDSYKFTNLTNLTSINGWEKYNVSNLTKYTDAFNGCTNLTEIDMSKWNFTALTGDVDASTQVVSNVFANGLTNCYSLTNFKTPKTINPTNTKVEGVFKSDLYTSLGYAIETNEDSTTQIKAANEITLDTDYRYQTKILSNVNRIGRYQFSSSNKTLYVIGGESNSCSKATASGSTTYTSVFTKFGNSSTKTDVVTVKFLSKLSFIKPTGSETASICGLFDGFTNLANIVGWENINVTNVSDFDGMFNGCGKLKLIDMNSWSVEKLSTMTDFVKDCDSLQYVITPSTITDTTNIPPKITAAIKPNSINWYNHKLDKLDTSIEANMLYSKDYALRNTLIYTPTVTDKVFTCSWNYENILKYSEFIKLYGRELSYTDTIATDISVSTFTIYSLNTPYIFTIEKETLKTVSTIKGLINLIDDGSETGVEISFNDYAKLEVADFTGCSFKVSSIDNMFNGCTSIEYVNFGSLDLSGITSDTTNVLNTTTSTKLVRLVTPANIPNKTFDGLTLSEWFSVDDTTTAVSTFAASKAYVRGLSDDNNKWNTIIYSTFDNILRLSSGQGKSTETETIGEGGVKTYSYASPFDSIKSTITKIIVEGKIIFADSTSLQDLFKEFTALTEVEGLDNIDCINVVDMKQMFKGCSSLCYINLFGLNTVNVTDVTSMFNGCPLVYLDLTTFNSSSLTDDTKTNMFDNTVELVHTPKLPISEKFKAQLLTTLTNFKDSASVSVTANSTIEKDTWYNNYTSGDGSITCNNGKTYIQYKDTAISLDSSTPPKPIYSWNTNKTLLETIDLRCKIDVSALTDLSNMFSGYSNLERIRLHTIDIGNVANISSMFANCEKLKYVNLANMTNLDTTPSKLTTVDDMFKGSPNIEVIDFTNINMSAVASSSTIPLFDTTKNYKIIYPSLTSSEKVIETLATTGYKYNGVVISKENIIPGNPYVSTTINNTSKWNSGDSADNCVAVEVDDLIKLVTYYDVSYSSTSGPAWKEKYKNILHSIDLNHVTITNAVTNCDDLFSDCVQLFNINPLVNIITYPQTNSSGGSSTTLYNCPLTSMKNMFKNCKTLEELNFACITGTTASALVAIDDMFQNCNSLRNLDLSMFTIDNNTTIGPEIDDENGNKINNSHLLDCTPDLTTGRKVIKQLESIKIPKFTITDTNPLTKFKSYFTDVFGSWYNQNGFSDPVGSSEDSIVSEALYKRSPGTWGTYKVTWDGVNKLTITGDTTKNGPGHGGYSTFTTNTSDIIWKNHKNTATTIEFTGYIRFINESGKANNDSAAGLFANFSALTSIQFGNGFNFYNIKTIDGMFYNCSALTTLDLNNVTFASTITNCENMFDGCTNLSEIILPKDYTDTENGKDVTSDKVKTKITSLICSGTNNWYDMTTNVQLQSDAELINSGHYGKEKIQWNQCDWEVKNGVLTITGETDSTKSAKLASSYSSTAPHYPWENNKDAITTVKIVGKIAFDKTNNTASLQDWFKDYSQLNTITGLNNVDVSNVINLSNAFYGTQIKELIINEWDVRQVTNATNMLPGTNSASAASQSLISRFKLFKPKIMVRDTVQTPLQIVHTPNKSSDELNTEFKTKFVNKFYDSNNNLVTTDSVIKPNEWYYSSDYNKKWNNAVRYRIGDDGTTMTLINNGAITNTLPTDTDIDKETLKFIMVDARVELPKDCTDMLKNCTALESFDFSQYVIPEITNTTSMFEGCTGLKVIDCKNTNLSKVTDATDMFKDCTALELVYTPKSFSPQLKTVFETLFKNTSKPFKDYTNSTVTEAKEHHWYHIASLIDNSGNATNKIWDVNNLSTYIEFIKNDNVSVKPIATNIIERILIREIYIFNNTTTDLTDIFKNYSNLVEVDLAGFRTWNVTKLTNMFNGCTKLVEVDLTNFITDNVIDFSGMFNGCTSLKTIKFNKY